MRACFKIINLKTFAIFITIILFIFLGVNRNICNENSICTNEIIHISNTENINNLVESNDVINPKWQLEIPKVGLVADIAEGTSSEILNRYIGHFEETEKENGNVALAAHNRGYPVNYFKDLKELEIGDEIYYTYNGTPKLYEVNNKKIIKDTEVEILEDTDEDILTLITCVENEPELRRCIQAIKIKKGDRIIESYSE